MPQTRRKRTNSVAASRSQSTLSFNSKSARVTKPSAQDSKKTASKLLEPAQVEVVDATTIPEPDDETPTTEIDAGTTDVETSVRTSPAKVKSKSKPSPPKDERENAAEKITDAQIKKYWKSEEDSRLAPRVHQSQVPLHEKILRHFDLSSQYGPCIGVSRLNRWKRANGLGLNPPVEVLAVLLREDKKETSQGCGKIAYIDELAGGRVVLVE